MYMTATPLPALPLSRPGWTEGHWWSGLCPPAKSAALWWTWRRHSLTHYTAHNHTHTHTHTTHVRTHMHTLTRTHTHTHMHTHTHTPTLPYRSSCWRGRSFCSVISLFSYSPPAELWPEHRTRHYAVHYVCIYMYITMSLLHSSLPILTSWLANFNSSSRNMFFSCATLNLSRTWAISHNQ